MLNNKLVYYVSLYKRMVDIDEEGLKQKMKRTYYTCFIYRVDKRDSFVVLFITEMLFIIWPNVKLIGAHSKWRRFMLTIISSCALYVHYEKAGESD